MPTKDPVQLIGECCIKINSASATDQVEVVLAEAAAAFGTNFYICGIRSGTKIDPPVLTRLTNYPAAWGRYYDQQGAIGFDPVIHNAFKFQGPFRWDGMHSSEKQLALRRESVRYGMNFGMTTSDRGADHSIALMSFCGKDPIAREQGQWERTASCLSILCTITHNAVTRILLKHAENRVRPGDPLSDSEVRCLGLIAEGRTAKEAALVMGVTQHTVRYYLDRAKDKMAVGSRKEAVAKAVQQGLVDTRRLSALTFSIDSGNNR